ncbi:MAG TPA: hypothetical protein VMC83_23695 [Streptosporangiaceae bacterium]|nr:hypothetical protein [Streptosporangiaceae bacterium]
MSTLEDRVRAAFWADAETVRPETIRGVPQRPARPGRRPRARGAGRTSRTARWLAPVAAVIAVIGVIVGVHLAAPPVAPSSVGALTGLPPYYVTLTGAMSSHRPVLTAAVHDSETGALLTSVNVPVRQKVPQPLHHASHSSAQLGAPPPMPSGISASANGRTFAITDDVGFFLLRVAADGRSAQLSRLPIRASYVLSDSAALSPDGNQLAIDVESCKRVCRQGIEVVSLATGASKLWLGPSMAGPPLSPAWVGSGAEIMFQWQVGSSSALEGYRLLDISGAGGSLLGSSRAMVSPQAQSGWQFAGPMLLTPDGHGLLTTEYRNVPGQDGGGTAMLRVVELSASTGQLLRVLHAATEHYGAGWAAHVTADAACQVLSLGPTGVHALIRCPGLGRLDGDRFTPLPGVPVIMNGGTGIGGAVAW